MDFRGVHGLPVGYVFLPTDEELISSYLRSKILNQPLPSYVVQELGLYDYSPEQLEELYGARKENEMYFFTKRKVNSTTATRASRSVANGGFWKASTKRIPITDCKGDIIGYKLLLNYFRSKGNMTNWLMYEYTTPTGLQKMDELVLCKVYNKKNEHKHKINAQQEEPCRNVEPQLLTTNYQVDDVVLHDQNVEPQALPTYQVADHIGFHDLRMQPSANQWFTTEELYGTVEPNVVDYQPPVVRAPTDQYHNFNTTDEPINAADQYNQQQLMPQAHENTPTDGDLEFAKDLEEQLQESGNENGDLEFAKDLEEQLQESGYDIPMDHQFLQDMEAQLQEPAGDIPSFDDLHFADLEAFLLGH